VVRLVVVESPYAGEVIANVGYAKRCFRNCLDRGEAPYASHLLFTQEGILDDEKAEERKLGIQAGLAWAAKAHATALYVDRGITPGMAYGVLSAYRLARIIEVRSLDTLDRTAQTEASAILTVELKMSLRDARGTDEELAAIALRVARDVVERALSWPRAS
jgi:hypothetical protein